MYCPMCGKEAQENSLYCQYCGSSIEKPTSVQKSIKKQGIGTSEIKEVKISFEQSDGTYPSKTKKDRSGDFLGYETEWSWSPSFFNNEYIRKILMEEINKWMTDGWQLVETDLDSVYITDSNYDSTMGSKLVNFIRPLSTKTYVTTITYLGALFHVRR